MTAMIPLPPGFSDPTPWSGVFTTWSAVAMAAPWISPAATRSGMLVCTFSQSDCDVMLDDLFVSTAPFEF